MEELRLTFDLPFLCLTLSWLGRLHLSLRTVEAKGVEGGG